MSVHWSAPVWKTSPYEGTRLLIHLALADIAHEDGRFFASQTLIAERARCTPNYVRSTVNDMVERGLIRIIEPGRGRGHATVYQLLTPTSSGAETPKTQTPNSVGEIVETPNSEAETPKSTSQPPKSRLYHSSFTTVLDTRPSLSSDSFDEFWSTYPRKEGKKAAKRSWDRAIRDADPETIIAGARRYADDPNREEAFTAHPTTWLNQGRWEDAPLPARNGSRRPSAAEMYADSARRLSETDLESLFAPRGELV